MNSVTLETFLEKLAQHPFLYSYITQGIWLKEGQQASDWLGSLSETERQAHLELLEQCVDRLEEISMTLEHQYRTLRHQRRQAHFASFVSHQYRNRS